MTTHRIPAEQMIVEPDRRLRQIPISTSSGFYTGDRRSPKIGDKPHDYSKPLCIVNVPVDLPELNKKFKYLGETVAPGFSGKFQFEMLNLQYEVLDPPAFYFTDCPFSPQDKIIATEAYEVIKVLGVQEKKTPYRQIKMEQGIYDVAIKEKWHFKLLCKEQNETR